MQIRGKVDYMVGARYDGFFIVPIDKMADKVRNKKFKKYRLRKQKENKSKKIRKFSQKKVS